MNRGAWVLLASYALAMALLFRPTIHGADPVGYFSWLHTIVIDRDLNNANEFDHFGTAEPRTAAFRPYFHHLVLTPNGYPHNQWPPGSALMWAPAYLVAHAMVLIANVFGIAVEADGYSWPYQFAAAFTSTLGALAAMLLTYHVARRWFTAFVAALATFTAWFASPLVFYGFSHPLMPHANDALMFALILTAWYADRGRATPRGGLLLGLAIGLATWVRNQNAAFMLAPLVVAGTEVVAGFHRRHADRARQAIGWTLGIALGFATCFVPLMFFWRAAYGAWLVNTYAPTHPPGSFDFYAPHVLGVLLSSNRGLFVWSPIALIGLAGLWWLRELDRRFTLFLAILFLIQLYVVGGWTSWHGGVAFGPRFWTNMTPLFALGCAAVLARLAWLPSWAAVAAGVTLVVWNLLLIGQYALYTVPRKGPVDLVAMVENQFLVIPSRAHDLLNAALQRADPGAIPDGRRPDPRGS